MIIISPHYKTMYVWLPLNSYCILYSWATKLGTQAYLRPWSSLSIQEIMMSLHCLATTYSLKLSFCVIKHTLQKYCTNQFNDITILFTDVSSVMTKNFPGTDKLFQEPIFSWVYIWQEMLLHIEWHSKLLVRWKSSTEYTYYELREDICIYITLQPLEAHTTFLFFNWVQS